MTNEELGISAIKLIFTIIILAIIISGIIFVVKRLWQDNSIKDIGTDLLYIKAKCKIIHDKNIIDPNEQLLGEKITEYAESEEINKIISQSDKWYKLGQSDLENIGLGNLKAEDGYIVNYEEEDVIYAKGIEENEKTYYKLSDLEAHQEEEALEDKTQENEQQTQNVEQGEEQTQDEAKSEEQTQNEVKSEAQVPNE